MYQLIKSLNLVFSHPLNKNKKWITLIRLIWWKINQVIIHIPVIVQLTNNRKCICYPESSNGGLIYYVRLFDYDEMLYILESLRIDDVFIDIGANIGIYSLLASSVITKGNIYAFEPFPMSYIRLEENIRLNDIRNIQVVKKIVSNDSRFEYFKTEKESEINHIAYKDKERLTRISSVKLDDFINKNNIKNISLMKIDVEGAEMKVLQGAEKSINNKKILKILIELNKNNQHFGTDNQKIAKWLEKKQFTLYFMERGNLKKVIHLNEINNDKIINLLAVKNI